MVVERMRPNELGFWSCCDAATARRTASCCALVRRGEGSAVRGLRRSLDRVETRDEESPLVVGHELAVEAIEKRRDADVRGAGSVGARQDAIRGGAGDRGLRRVRVGLRRRRSARPATNVTSAGESATPARIAARRMASRRLMAAPWIPPSAGVMSGLTGCAS